MYRRFRKPNYTHEETMALLEQINLHKHILFGKSNTHQRAEFWAVVADAVNSVPTGTTRTVEELKHRWKDMSHRARNAARSLYQARTNNEKPQVSPPVYFDTVMKIIGEDMSDFSDFTAPVSNDSQSSASRLTDDSQMGHSGSGDVDIKPDVAVLNRIISSNNKCDDNLTISGRSSAAAGEHSNHPPMHRKRSSSGSPIGSVQFTATDLLHSDNNMTNSRHKLPTFNEGNDSYSRSAKPMPRQYPSQFYDHLTSPSPLHSTKHRTASEPPQPSNSSLSLLKSQASVPRSMRFDPDTQEITQVDDLDLDSDSSEDDGFHLKLASGTVGEGLEGGTVDTGEPIQKMLSATRSDSHIQQPKKRRRLEQGDGALQSLSLEDLKKLYIIQKIQMINQKAECFRILKKKLKYELKATKHQSLLRHYSTSRHHYSDPVTVSPHKSDLQEVSAVQTGECIDEERDNSNDEDRFLSNTCNSDNCMHGRSGAEIVGQENEDFQDRANENYDNYGNDNPASENKKKNDGQLPQNCDDDDDDNDNNEDNDPHKDESPSTHFHNVSCSDSAHD